MCHIAGILQFVSCDKQIKLQPVIINVKLVEYSEFVTRREWVTSLNLIVYILYRCTQLSKLSLLQWRLQILPVHCLTPHYCYSFSRVHHGSKRGETDASCRRHQYAPVYRQLANENKLKTAMPREHPLVGSSCRKPRLDHKFLKIRFISNSSNQIFGYKFDLRKGSRLSSWKDSYNVESFSLILKEAHVRLSAHEVTPMVSGNTADILSIWISHFLCLWFTVIIFSGGPIVQF